MKSATARAPVTHASSAPSRASSSTSAGYASAANSPVGPFAPVAPFGPVGPRWFQVIACSPFVQEALVLSMILSGAPPVDFAAFGL
jgi:hypothetical protein